jgi:hypothetical protein
LPALRALKNCRSRKRKLWFARYLPGFRFGLEKFFKGVDWDLDLSPMWRIVEGFSERAGR